MPCEITRCHDRNNIIRKSCRGDKKSRNRTIRAQEVEAFRHLALVEDIA